MHSDRVSTTGSESRKSSKPIMEKRRRARINASLAELKSLLLEVIKKEGARHSKMEKADILEMAVKHLRQVQRQQYTGGGSNGNGGSTDPTLSDKYRLGFNECAQEVSRYLGAADDDDAELRARLLNHLANCITTSSSGGGGGGGGVDDSPLSPLSSCSAATTPPSSSPPSSLEGHVTSSSVVGGVMTPMTSMTPVTPVTPIPVRPVSSKAAGGVSGLSLIAAAAAAATGDPGGSSPPASSATALLVPTTEINNNTVGLANNNHHNHHHHHHQQHHVVLVDGAVEAGTQYHHLQHPHHHPMTLSPVTSLSSSSSSLVGGRKVMGEVQVVGGAKGAGGEGGVALVLPANMMTGGPLPSYIIPLYASPHPLSAAAGLSLTPPATLPPPATLSFTSNPPQPPPSQQQQPPPQQQQQQQQPPSLPLSLSLMATTTTPTPTRTPALPDVPAATGSGPSLVTLTPGATAAVLPPAGLGSVLAEAATGVNGPLAWQTAATAATAGATATVYPTSTVSGSSAPSSTSSPFLPVASSAAADLSTCGPSSISSSSSLAPGGLGEAKAGEDRVSSSSSSSTTPSLIPPPPPALPLLPSATVSAVAVSVSAADGLGSSAESAGSGGGGGGGGRFSLLQSQLMRPQGSSGPGLPAPDGCVWRPWW